MKLVDYSFPKPVVADALGCKDSDATPQLPSDQLGDLPILYAAPEILLEGPKHLDKPADVWALGCLVARIASTRPLYDSVRPDGLDEHLLSDAGREWLDDVLSEIVSSRLSPADDLQMAPDKLSQHAAEFVRACAVAEPTDRPDIEAVAALLKERRRAAARDGRMTRREARETRREARETLRQLPMSAAEADPRRSGRFIEHERVEPSRLPAPSMHIPAAALPAPVGSAAIAQSSAAASSMMAGAAAAEQLQVVARRGDARRSDARRSGARQSEIIDDDQESASFLVLAPVSTTACVSSADAARDSAAGTKAIAARPPARGTRTDNAPADSAADEAAAPVSVREHTPSMVYLPTRIGDITAADGAADDDDVQAPVSVREHTPSMVYLPTRIGDITPASPQKRDGNPKMTKLDRGEASSLQKARGPIGARVAIRTEESEAHVTTRATERTTVFTGYEDSRFSTIADDLASGANTSQSSETASEPTRVAEKPSPWHRVRPDLSVPGGGTERSRRKTTEPAILSETKMGAGDRLFI